MRFYCHDLICIHRTKICSIFIVFSCLSNHLNRTNEKSFHRISPAGLENYYCQCVILDFFESVSYVCSSQINSIRFHGICMFLANNRFINYYLIWIHEQNYDQFINETWKRIKYIKYSKYVSIRSNHIFIHWKQNDLLRIDRMRTSKKNIDKIWFYQSNALVVSLYSINSSAVQEHNTARAINFEYKSTKLFLMKKMNW